MPIEMRLGRFGLVLTCLWPGSAAFAEAPLSAIDWLSQSVAAPVATPTNEEPPVTDGALPDDVAVSVIGGPSLDAVGLLSPQVTGLPRNLWGLGLVEEIAALVTKERTDTLPALKELLITVLLAEADAPADAGQNGTLLLSRIDKLLDMGALEQAEALIKASGSTEAELFRREFDIALLTGSEDAACVTMQDAPNLAPTFPARIFCLARSGDWNAAALALRTGQALGYVTEEDDALLSRFLDPDLYEGEASPTVPLRPTPLVWRMFAAIGEPLPTSNLPVAFAHAELHDTTGWKAQIEAAERLVRAGVVSENLLLGLYTERRPAASGGVWDRVDAIQDLEAALQKNNMAAIERALPVVWGQMAGSELEVPFAKMFAAQLAQYPLQGEAAKLAFRIGLLSDQYERFAAAHSPVDATEAFLAGLARGQLNGAPAPDSLGRAIAPAFTNPAPAPEALALLEQGRLGEAVLTAIDQVGRGVQGDLRGVTEGLSLLRKVGMEDAARRTSLELMLLERRG